MTTISKLGTSYAVIAPTSYNASQKALNDVAAAAGNDPPPTQISLSTQAQELSSFSAKLVGLTTANSNFENSRGLNLSSDAQASLKTAYTTASQRLTITGIRANGAQNAAQGSSLLGAKISSVADFLTKANADAASYGNSDNSGFFDFTGSSNSGSDSSDIFTTLAKQYKKKNAAFAQALKLQNGQTPTSASDPYDRKLATKYSTAGSTTLDVSESALKGSSVAVAIQKGLVPGDSVNLVTTVANGHTKSGAQGIAVNVKTGNQNAVVALDTRDPLESDSRTSAINVTTGNGSNVVYLAGTNDSVIHTGDGDNIVVAEGNATIFGGKGSDFLVGNNVSGGGGNDTIFASHFAYAGEGNNTITLFSVSSSAPDDKNLPTAIAGNGNNTILADVKGNVIAGNGANAIILRQGGSVATGDGASKITAEASADVTVGNGKNDIFLAAGGTATVGNGNNTIAASSFASVTLGSGSNQVQLQAGGNIDYKAGGGTNQVLIGPIPQNDHDASHQVNTITLNNLLYSDITLTPVAQAAIIAENSGTGSINITSVGGAQDVKLVFNKNGQQQIVTISNSGAVSVGNVYTP